MGQNNINTGSGSSLFIQKHSVMIRIWHWLTFLVLSASIITVLLTSTLLNQRKNAGMVREQLKTKGIIVTEDQAFAVSRKYEDMVWSVHKSLGYGLAFLLFSRILIELMQPADEKVFSRVKSAFSIYSSTSGNKRDYRNYLVVKCGHLLFYFLLLLMIVTGIGLAVGSKLSFSRGLHNTIKEIHSMGQFLIYAFVFFHLYSVILADISKAKGIVSGMINGNKSSLKY